MPSGKPNTPCKICGTLFYSCPSIRKLGKGKYCSNACAALDPERRAAISKRFKGKPHTPEWNAKISASNMGKRMSPESREKMRKAKAGRTLTPEHKEKIGKAMKGRVFSEESRLKISQSKMGTHLPEKTRDKISKARKGKYIGENNPNYGKHLSEETRLKLSKAHMGKATGRRHSEETRKKMAEAQKGERHYNWQGGLSFEPYCPKFNDDFRERVRAFFGHQCQFPGCGKKWKPGQRRHSVHHVNFRKDSCCTADVKPLFVPLCPSCHGKVNFDREYWEQYFTELIAIQCGGKCFLSVNEMENRTKL